MRALTRRAMRWVCMAAVVLGGTGMMAGGAAGAALPDGRAYEMVSPPAKNGGEAIAVSSRTRSAADGGAVTFASLAAFGDVLGTGTATDYMAVRSAQPNPGDNGWSTHALTPPQDAQTVRSVSLVAGEPHYLGALSSDLKAGVMVAWSPLTDDPEVASLQNLYVRHDLRTPGAGSYQLVTGCPSMSCSSFPANGIFKVFRPFFAGASSDFEHVVFESSLPLVAGANFLSGANTYEWDHGTLRLVSVLPDGSIAPDSHPGQAPSFGGAPTQAPVPISDDGSRIVFVNTPDGTSAGDLYLRIGGRTSVPLNVSERRVPDTHGTATYWGMSRDGSRIFFSTGERLTDDAVGSVGLYMWAKQDSDETQSVAVDATAGTYTLTVEGQTTAPIAFDASATAVQAALEALPAIGSGNVTVAGGPGDAGATSPYSVTFTRDLAGVGVPQMTADSSSLTGTATVTTTRAVHNITFLSTDNNPSSLADEVQGVIGASDDGHYVYFVAKGQIVAGEPDLGLGAGVYLWHDGTVAYVGKLADFPFDSLYVYDGAVSTFPMQSQVTPDGRHLVLDSSSGEGLLSVHGGTDYDQSACSGTFGGCQELYVYSADTGRLACASCNPTGAPATANAWARTIDGVGASTLPNYVSRIVSDDGHYVFFSTPEALVPEDVNGRLDAYEYDTVTGQVHLLSSGTDPSNSYFLESSPSGRDAFFVTRQQLVGWDRDQASDLYDARIDGGFPEPVLASQCSGDACQGALGAAPAVVGAGSVGAQAQGNVSGSLKRARRVVRCRRGQVRKRVHGKVRCVKKRRHHRRNAKRGARTTSKERAR